MCEPEMSNNSTYKWPISELPSLILSPSPHVCFSVTSSRKEPMCIFQEPWAKRVGGIGNPECGLETKAKVGGGSYDEKVEQIWVLVLLGRREHGTNMRPRLERWWVMPAVTKKWQQVGAVPWNPWEERGLHRLAAWPAEEVYPNPVPWSSQCVPIPSDQQWQL